MTNRTWIGGGNNEASNPNDWVDSNGLPGAPQPGDLLFVYGFTNFTSPLTMNVSGNDLSGDEVILDRPTATFIANLSHKAIMTADVSYGGYGTFNVTQNSTLTLANEDVFGRAIVNISGADTVILDTTGGGFPQVNLAPGAKWDGSFNGFGFGLNAGAGSVFSNDGNSFIRPNGPQAVDQATITADVIGNGSFDVGGGTRLEFVKSVGPNQSVVDRGLAQIDQPSLFAASITLAAPLPSELSGTPLPAEIDLNGLAQADSYTYNNDMLNIFASNKVIDTLRLHDATQFGFEVEKTRSGVNVLAYTDSSHTQIGTVLPIHV